MLALLPVQLHAEHAVPPASAERVHALAMHLLQETEQLEQAEGGGGQEGAAAGRSKRTSAATLKQGTHGGVWWWQNVWSQATG